MFRARPGSTYRSDFRYGRKGFFLYVFAAFPGYVALVVGGFADSFLTSHVRRQDCDSLFFFHFFARRRLRRIPPHEIYGFQLLREVLKAIKRETER